MPQTDLPETPFVMNGEISPLHTSLCKNLRGPNKRTVRNKGYGSERLNNSEAPVFCIWSGDHNNYSLPFSLFFSGIRVREDFPLSFVCHLFCYITQIVTDFFLFSLLIYA